MSIKPYLSYFIKICISVILLIYVSTIIDFKLILDGLSYIHPSIYLLACIFGLLQVFINAVTQKIFFSMINERLGLWNNYSHNLIGSFYGFFFPSTIGSDLYFTHYFTKTFTSLKKALLGVMLIRITGLVIFIGLIVFALSINLDKYLFLFKFFNFNKSLLLFASLMFFGLITFFVLRKRFASKYTEVIGLIKQVLYNKKRLVIFLLLILFWYFFSVAGRVFFAWAVGIDLSFINLATIIMLASFILMVPISISGFGLRELSYITLLGFFGIVPEKAILVSTIDLVVLLSAIFTGGIILLNKTFLNKIW